MSTAMGTAAVAVADSATTPFHHNPRFPRGRQHRTGPTAHPDARIV